jgi:hypothetical protein
VAERIAALHAEYARACSLENQLELRPT